MTTVDTTTPATTSVPAPGFRAIDGVYGSPGLHWVGDGFRVAGYFSAIPNAARKLDPFLLLDYHPEHTYAPTESRRGVGVHPHRGFETVTFAFQGGVAHHDSTGGGGVIGPGDVQWMTAASGILHKEYHEQEYARRGGPFQMVQLWVNLPSASKMAEPRYQPITSGRIPVVALPDGAGSVRVIAGEFGGVRGPAETFSPIAIHDVTLRRGGTIELTFPTGHTTALLVMQGDLGINGPTLAEEDDFVVFTRDDGRIAIEAITDAHFMVLDGEPLGEPIVQHGPFVMNTPQEIRQAMIDYQDGAFGTLDD